LIESNGQGLSLDGVSVNYGSVSALRNVDFKMARAECVGLVGLSGAGKTTLLGLFNGMVRPDRGHVHTLGTRLDTLSHRGLRTLRTSVGFVHQGLHLVPNLNVLQNVLLGRLGQISMARALVLLTLPSRETLGAVHELLERVGIGDKLYERVDRLSGGELQRVAIARALFQKPRILLADEPVSSVDPARARSVLELLTGVAREDGLTLCVSLHNVDLAREFFPRLVGMKAGRLAFDKPASAISEDQLHSLFQL
jgi:phosphonate transport system ATP-binding protein